MPSIRKNQLQVLSAAVVEAKAPIVQRPPGTFGYVNDEDPFEDDQQLEASPWWELNTEPGQIITLEMTSEALWHALMISAEGIRYKYVRHVPHIKDVKRQREAAHSMIVKLQLLDQFAGNLLRMGLVQANGANFTWLRDNIDGMQMSFQKRYGGFRVM